MNEETDFEKQHKVFVLFFYFWKIELKKHENYVLEHYALIFILKYKFLL